MALHLGFSLWQGVSGFRRRGCRDKVGTTSAAHDAGSWPQVDLAAQFASVAPARRPVHRSVVLLLSLLSGCGGETDLARAGREALAALAGGRAEYLEALSAAAPATSAQAAPESSIAPTNGGPRAHVEGAF